MKFQLKGHTGSGSAHAPINFDSLHWYDHTPLQFRTTLYPVLKKPEPFDTEKRKRLELTWYHWIFYKGSELFQFHSYSEYFISEPEITPTPEQLKEMVIDSHNYLRQSFEERRKEFFIFEPLEQISEDTIQQTANQLHSFLLQQPQ